MSLRLPLRAAQLDAMSCQDCGASDCALEVQSTCHPGEPVIVSYRLASLVIDCAGCGGYICMIAVAP